MAVSRLGGRGRLPVTVRGLIVQHKRLGCQRPIGFGLEEVDTFFCALQLLIAIAVQMHAFFVELQRLFQVKVFRFQGLDDFLEALQGLLEGQIGHRQTPSSESHQRYRSVAHHSGALRPADQDGRPRCWSPGAA